MPKIEPQIWAKFTKAEKTLFPEVSHETKVLTKLILIIKTLFTRA